MPFILVPTTFLLLLFPDGRLLSPRWRVVGWCASIGIASLLRAVGPPPRADLRLPEGHQPVRRRQHRARRSGGARGSGARPRECSDRPCRSSSDSAAAAASSACKSSGSPSRGRSRHSPSSIATALYDVVGEATANAAIMLSVLGLPAATGVAIRRHRLYEIDVVINRTLVYATLTAGLAAIYAGVSLSLGVALGAGSTLPTAAATLAVALGFRPLRSRVQAQVDRRFDRARYEALRQGRELSRGSARRPRRAGVDGRDDGAGPRRSRASSSSSGSPRADVHVDATGRVVDQLADGGAGCDAGATGDARAGLGGARPRPRGAPGSARERDLSRLALRSRSPGSEWRCACSWRKSRRRALASSPSATRNAAGWNATSTTARSRGSSRSGLRCETFNVSCRRRRLPRAEARRHRRRG